MAQRHRNARLTHAGDSYRDDDSLPEILPIASTRCALGMLFASFLLRGLPVLTLKPLQEPITGGDDALSLRVRLELVSIAIDLVDDPVHVHLRLRPAQLPFRHIRDRSTLRQQCLRHLSPVAVHHVRLVELDLEEERGARLVRRQARWLPTLGRRLDHLRAHHEALERLPVPLARLADALCELLHFGDGLQDGGLGGYKAPLARERVNGGLVHRLEVFGTLV